MNLERALQILESLAEATSGGVAGACSTGVLYPLDVLLVRYQAASGGLGIRSVPIGLPSISDGGSSADGGSLSVLPTPRGGAVAPYPIPSVLDIIMKTIQEKGGVLKAMYGGLEVKLVEVLVRNFVYFYWYRSLKFLWEEKVGPIDTTSSLIVATVAAILNQTTTAPLELISTRIQTSNVSFLTAIKQILKEDGFLGFYRGFRAALILCINPALTNATFDRMKYLLQLLLLASLRRNLGILSLDSQRPSPFDPELPALTALQSFIIGAIAKSIATLVTYPIIRSKILLQSSQTGQQQHRKSSQFQQSPHLEHAQKVTTLPNTPVHHPNKFPSSNRTSDTLHPSRSSSRFFRPASFCASDNGTVITGFSSIQSMAKQSSSSVSVDLHHYPHSVGSLLNERKHFTINEPPNKSVTRRLLDLTIIPNDLPKNEKGVLGIIITTIMNEGVPGLYRGLFLQLFKTVLGAALLYMIKEKIHKDVKKVFFFAAFYAMRRMRKRSKRSPS